MHELTLAESAVGIAVRAAENAAAKRITRIRLSIGALAHIDADAMQYCCEMVSRGTLADGAAIAIDRTPGIAQCHGCGKQIELSKVGDPCPQCGSFQLEVTDGDQMQVVDIGVE